MIWHVRGVLAERNVGMTDPVNEYIASKFDEVAMLLEQQGANPYRVAAYRQAATTLRNLKQPVTEILEQEGPEGLMRLPGIGTGLSRSIQMLVITGHLPLLDRLRGESASQQVLMTVPGIGPKLAEKLYEDLGIDSLEDLEAAAIDGRLRNLAGMGEKRLAGIRDVLARRLGRIPPLVSTTQAPVNELLDVDREYREKADAGELRTIAPRRFNPDAEAWLPILHTRRGEREYTALFSNTSHAHELNKTHDWVVIYCDDGSRGLTSTVITAQRGRLKGRRVVRGREADSAAYYGLINPSEKDAEVKDAEVDEAVQVTG
jgi:putative hydrolase